MTAPELRQKRTTDPLGKSALFSPPTPGKHAETTPDEGVKALYSPATEWQLGTVVMECSECLARTRVPLHDAAMRILRFSVWIPGRGHSRWLSCPSCERRTWSRIHWTG
jgi:hypothetical protein